MSSNRRTQTKCLTNTIYKVDNKQTDIKWWEAFRGNICTDLALILKVITLAMVSCLVEAFIKAFSVILSKIIIKQNHNLTRLLDRSFTSASNFSSQL